MQETRTQNWIGLDVSKKDFYAALRTPGEKSFMSQKFKRTKDGAMKMLSWARALTPDDGELFVVMESTGCYSRDLAEWFGEIDSELHVSVENARTIHSYITSLGNLHKTDKSDAIAIAKYGEERQPEQTPQRRECEKKLRQLVGERQELVKVRSMLKNREETISDADAKSANINSIKALSEQIEKLDVLIDKCIENDQILREERDLMTSVPGVSTVIICTVMATFGHLGNYTSRELSALSGLAPRLEMSGTSVNKASISRRSSSQLRQALYMGSLHGIKLIPSLQDLYDRLIQKGKSKMAARCACMRKLLTILRGIVVSGKPFDPNYQRADDLTIAQ